MKHIMKYIILKNIHYVILTVFLNRYQVGIIEPVDLSTEYFIG